VLITAGFSLLGALIVLVARDRTTTGHRDPVRLDPAAPLPS
jgi:hypothetical protein